VDRVRRATRGEVFPFGVESSRTARDPEDDDDDGDGVVSLDDIPCSACLETMCLDLDYDRVPVLATLDSICG
jgi:hypothetical protein